MMSMKKLRKLREMTFKLISTKKREHEKNWKEVSKEEESHAMKEKEDDNKDKNPICKHYIRGTCRHGLTGKTAKYGILKCRFKHPETCMKWLNYGSNTSFPKGCQEGKTVENSTQGCAGNP